jgi:hypothetical protein
MKMKNNSKMPLLLLMSLLLIATFNQGVATGPIISEKVVAEPNPPVDPWTNVLNGTRVNIAAGNRTHLRFHNGTQIQLQVNESVQLQINETKTNPTGDVIPSQMHVVRRYLHIELNGTVSMNATMFHNYTNAELSELGNVSTFRWAWYNEETHEWQYAEENWVEITPEGATVFCNTDHFSIWTIFVAETPVRNPSPGTPFNPDNGTGFMVMENSQYQIKTQSGFSLQLQLNKTGEVTVSEFEESPKNMNRQRHQIRTQVMNITTNVSAGINATFSYQFNNQSQYENLEQLKFMFYNETSGAWEAPKNQWLEGDTLYCNTTHFSLWTVAEEEVDASATPGFTIVPLLAVFLTLVAPRRKK